MKIPANLLALSILLGIAAAAHAEDWGLIEQMTTQDEGGKAVTANLYADKDSVRRKGDLSSITTKINGRSAFSSSHFDCATRQVLELAEARPVQDGGVDDKLFRLACKSRWLPW